MKFLPLFLALFLGSSSMYAQSKPREIVADGRMLALIRNHGITVADVMKKLDVAFYQQYPQFRDSSSHRLQFYDAHWKEALQEMIERQLIVLFAEDNHMTLSHGEVREELEEMFGPNTLLNLYDAHISLDEAYEFVRQDIIARRVLQFYVRMPVQAQITPQKILDVYKAEYEERGKEEKISWQVLSLRAPSNSPVEKKFAQLVEALQIHDTTFEQAQVGLPEHWELTLSPLFVTDVAKLASSVRSVLDAQPIQKWTAPIQVKESKEGFVKWSSYLVVHRAQGEKIPMSQVEQEIQMNLFEPLYAEKKRDFVQDLAKKYEVLMFLKEQEMSSYHPFRLR